MNETTVESNYDGRLVCFLDRAISVLSKIVIACAIVYFGIGFILVKINW